MSDPKIISALIAAIVSLLIASITGLYIVYKFNRRLKDLRDELVMSKKTERLIADCEGFRKAFRVFQKEANLLNFRSSEDILIRLDADFAKLVQLSIDFYASHGRDLYKENLDVFKSPEFERHYEKIAKLATPRILDNFEDHNRMNTAKELYISIRDFSNLLHAEALKY